jgi:hypothetical protein
VHRLVIMKELRAEKPRRRKVRSSGDPCGPAQIGLGSTFGHRHPIMGIARFP